MIILTQWNEIKNQIIDTYTKPKIYNLTSQTNKIILKQNKIFKHDNIFNKIYYRQ